MIPARRLNPAPTISAVLQTFARRPEYQSVFPLGVSLAQWVTA